MCLKMQLHPQTSSTSRAKEINRLNSCVAEVFREYFSIVSCLSAAGNSLLEAPHVGVACIFLERSYWIRRITEAQLMIWWFGGNLKDSIYKCSLTWQSSDILKMYPSPPTNTSVLQQKRSSFLFWGSYGYLKLTCCVHRDFNWLGNQLQDWPFHFLSD